MNKTPEQIIQELLDPATELREEELQQLIAEDPSAAVLVLLELARRVRAALPSPATPSGQLPVYTKPPAPKRCSKPGRKPGHPGACRSLPERIDRQIEHSLEQCPYCATSLRTVKTKTRTRIIIDLPETIQPVVTEHIIPRGYCPNCKKQVEPPVPDALPNATAGNRLLSLTAHWHYALGMPISQIVSLLSSHLRFTISSGGLVAMWHRLAQILSPWYEQLIEDTQNSLVLHGDETGWRVNGRTHWLWCFSNTSTTVYFIHSSRGSPALREFFHETFKGTVVTDFWSAYDTIAGCQRQFCLAHLLRELEKVDVRNRSEEWCAFSRKTRRLFRDTLRLRRREDFSPETYASRILKLNHRLISLMYEPAQDADVKRLSKRLQKYWDELLVFLDDPTVPPTNNHAEREIRPAVIMRKVIQGNRSDRGARTQMILMTIFRTLKARGCNPADTIVQSLTQYLKTGSLPPFPPANR
ncbi:MAG: IS66 family transposase [bacterium]